MNVTLAKLADRWLGGFGLRLLRPWRLLKDLFGAEEELRAVREIAVVKFWGVGNAALLVPLLTALRRRSPGARITFVTLAQNAPVVQIGLNKLIS